MQEMNHPDGTVSREFFSELEMKAGKMEQRRKALEAQGFKYNRVAFISTNKFEPHNGSKEMARRRRQMYGLKMCVPDEEGGRI